MRAFNGFFLLGDPAVSFTATGQEQGILWGQDRLHSSLPICMYPFFPVSAVGYGSWFEHVQEFWEHRMDANVLFLKYEDMHRVSSWRDAGEIRSIREMLSLALELSVVLGLGAARTKWRHGRVMQSQKATEGGMGGGNLHNSFHVLPLSCPGMHVGHRGGLGSSP